MSVSLRAFNGDLGGVACRICDQVTLWCDHDNNVWCAECLYWNGWFVASFFCQPKHVPRTSPDGDPTLF